MFRPHNGDIPELKGSVLVLPALSLGNVGQLAIDAMVVTLGAESVGFVEDDAVVPVVGNDVFSKLGTGVASPSLEVFHRKREGSEFPVTMLQQRSPVVRGQNKAFAKRIALFIQNIGFSHVILLLSSDATRRLDCQLSGTQMRCITIDQLSRYLQKNVASALSGDSSDSTLPKLPTATSNPITSSYDQHEAVHRATAHLDSAEEPNENSQPSLASLLTPTSSPILPFMEEDTIANTVKSGTFAYFLSQLFVSSSPAHNSASEPQLALPPFLILNRFVHEGYNFPEGLEMASSISHLLRLPLPTLHSSINWTLPASWRYAIKSPPPDSRLY